MRQLRDRVAVVTGAAGSLGSLLAEALATEGCHLALADLDPARLEALAARLAPTGVRVTTHAVDVRTAAALDALAAEVEAAHGGCQLLVNAAGVTIWGVFTDQPAHQIDWLLDVNVRGTLHACRAFAPLLAAAHEAHVVNLCSMVGMFGVPIQSTYSASKWAIRGFSEALRAEWAPRGIGVTAVLPGAVANDFLGAGGVHDPTAVDKVVGLVRQHGVAPERVVAALLDGVRRNRAEVVVGVDAKLVAWTQRLAPGLLPALVRWSYRRFTPDGRIT
ncbi:MAG: SDR family NAD(P)-dependent oxidoreductase [Alphaproteobacteria bacterium]|nr:SDR family NAD(P)-dependent oxidoreductase [Alphaproteobacteria bacterium]